MDNGDNGVYLIKDWQIVGRRYFSGTEQDCYGLHEFLCAVDESQPENQQLGRQMIECLVYHDKAISDVSWNYQYEMSRRAEEGLKVEGFRIGKFYAYNKKDPKSYARVIDNQDGRHPGDRRTGREVP